MLTLDCAENIIIFFKSAYKWETGASVDIKNEKLTSNLVIFGILQYHWRQQDFVQGTFQRVRSSIGPGVGAPETRELSKICKKIRRK